MRALSMPGQSGIRDNGDQTTADLALTCAAGRRAMRRMEIA